MTIELMDRIQGFRSLIVPLFFVATAEMNVDYQSFNVKTMGRAHNELFLRCWEHDLKWAPSIIQDWSIFGFRNDLIRPLMRLALAFGIDATKELIKSCREEYGTDMGQMMVAHEKGEMRMGTHLCSGNPQNGQRRTPLIVIGEGNKWAKESQSRPKELLTHCLTMLPTKNPEFIKLNDLRSTLTFITLNLDMNHLPTILAHIEAQ